MQSEIIGRLPTIPEYYQMYINRNVNLLTDAKQCCPFHKEDTPSFSYSAERRAWRCFGSCKMGGDVIVLHQKNYNLSTREEAERSLKALHKVVTRVELKKQEITMQVSDERIYDESVYQEALLLANTVDRWLELDYFMSKTPIDGTELKLIIDRWKSEVEE